MSESAPVLTLNVKAEVAMLTFGGKEVWTSEPKPFYGTGILTTNAHFTIMQAGLNYYIFPTQLITIHGPMMEPPTSK